MITKKEKSWAVQDARARFSEFLDACLTEGPQIVARRGVKAAVLVLAKQQWEALQVVAKPSLKELLLAKAPNSDGLTTRRGRARRRPVEPLA